MIQKLLVALLALAANFLVVWYGNFSGRLPNKVSYLGFNFDSAWVRALITQFEYLWLLIIINFCFTLAFSLGFQSFKSLFVLMVIWISAAPIALLIFNSMFIKESVNWLMILGVILVVTGSIFVVSNKEILSYL